MYDDVISVSPNETEEDVAADIFKYDIPAMPVVDERGAIVGIVTTEDAWDAIEDDVSSERTKVSLGMGLGIALVALLVLALYTFVVVQIMSATGTWHAN